jgi:short-subunit dehydrogenase
MELKGKIAIVTGASKGIGHATVLRLLEEGVKVAGWSRTNPDILHPDFKFISADVGNADSVNSAYQETVAVFGDQISVLVNNAGFGHDGLIEEIPADAWLNMFNVNVHGVFFCSQKVIPGMKRRGEGNIINIASIAGTVGSEKLSGYCGSKFAVRGISQAMYKELRDYGVKVSVINPGSVKTSFFDHMSSMSTSNHMMQPEWIADSIIYVLKTPENYHPVEFEVRPLMPKGRKKLEE